MASALAQGFQAKSLSFKETMKQTARALWAGPLFRWRFSSFRPQSIRYAPLDFYLADPALAHEFYHGRFALAGRIVQTGPLSPFEVEAPTLDWDIALHNFSWLKHFDATQAAIASAHARSLLNEWIDHTGYKKNTIPWRGDVVGKRIIAWLSHSPMLLDGASENFRKRFLKSLGFQVRFLKTAIFRMPENEKRLFAEIALTFSALCLPVSEKHRKKASLYLEKSLFKQIFPDGGHISRNPALLIDLLTDLISLRHAYADCNEEPPYQLIAAIERMLPALRFFMHADMTLARFNGVGPLLPERLSNLLALDETAAGLLNNARYSGYQRLSAGETILIADTGALPPKMASQHANAGCLSFEMSSNNHRFIINCGIDPFGPENFATIGRSTAAHSTATINDTSSCRFKTKHHEKRIVSGPTKVTIENIVDNNRNGFMASHNGYVSRFSLMHERGLALSHNGNMIDGYDRFFSPGSDVPSSNGRDQVAIRFHLHPDIIVSHQGNGELHLEVKGGDIWTFSSPDVAPLLEDSIDLAGLYGPQRCQQIVLSFRPSFIARARWRFKRYA